MRRNMVAFLALVAVSLPFYAIADDDHWHHGEWHEGRGDWHHEDRGEWHHHHDHGYYHRHYEPYAYSSPQVYYNPPVYYYPTAYNYPPAYYPAPQPVVEAPVYYDPQPSLSLGFYFGGH